MTDTLAQDTQADLARLDAMLDQAEAADAAANQPATRTDSLTPEPEREQAAPDTAADGKGTEAPAGTETDAGKVKADAPKTDTTNQAPDKSGEIGKSRFAKEIERQDRSWKAINERKTEQDKREAELARREAELTQTRAKSEPSKFTADQYEQAATKFEADGKYDLAEAAREKAKQLRANPQSDTDARAQQFNQRHQQSLESSWARVKQDMPEALDKANPFNAALTEFIKAEPDVLGHPNGPYLAAKFVKAQLQGAKAEALQVEVTTLRARVKELEGRVTVPGSGPNSLPQPKSFNEMTLTEQERELERQYAEASG